jgi:PilZ domain
MTAGNNHGNGKPFTPPRVEPRFSNLRDLSVTYEGHSEDIATHLPDLSTRGMFINTNRVFPEGAVLIVKFRLATSGTEIQSRAEVRYCLAGVGVGVEFIGISAEAVRAIAGEVSIADEPVPHKPLLSKK